MSTLLSSTQRLALIARHRHERDRRICDRIKAVLLYDDGYSYSAIARILLVDDETIRRHLAAYVTAAKLVTTNGGSAGKLNDQQQAELTQYLRCFTHLYVKDICRYVKQTYAIRLSLSGMRAWLKRVGFRYKKPHGVPAKADAAAQQAFIDDYQQLKTKNEPIYFADSVHPQHQTKLSYGWIMRGERKAVAMTGYQKRLHITGAINLAGQRLVYQTNAKVDSSSVQQFLTLLRRQHPPHLRLHVILDNAGWHKTAVVKLRAQQLNIQLHYLPPYSPNLNPIERLWKLMHEHVTYQKYYAHFKAFQQATLQFLKTIGRKKQLLRRRITDHFQTLIPLNFAP